MVSLVHRVRKAEEKTKTAVRAAEETSDAVFLQITHAYFADPWFSRSAAVHGTVPMVDTF